LPDIFGKFKKIHFVGIGGIGMSGIAEILHNMGFVVTGSDKSDGVNISYLRSNGIHIVIGHTSENVKNVDVVVYSSAIKEDNVEILSARENYIPVIKRGEMLGELMRMKYSIAISGSHGKTTTSSMIAEIFNCAKLDPTVIIGGRLRKSKASASYGLSNLMICEADESDKSFLVLHPTVAVITNIDREHVDTYLTLEETKQSFISFANKIPFYGFNALCLDDPNVSDIIPFIEKKFITYGIKASADIKASNIVKDGFSIAFDVISSKGHLGRIKLNLPGIHNVLNALAAVAVSLEFEIPFKTIKNAMEKFGGVLRRLTIKYKSKDKIVIDDYGHHPAEIQVTLKAIREACPGYRVVVIFQPHRFSRTKILMNEFAKAFFDADKLFITDVYPAGEEYIDGADSEILVDEVKKHGFKDVFYLSYGDKDMLYKTTENMKNKATIFVTLGAGNITSLSTEIADYFIKLDEININNKSIKS